jgi:D-alanine-D-alanine ligase
LADGLIAESFVIGREFTTFVIGSGDSISCYPAVERIFHESLPDEEKFLSFDRLWEIYEEEKPMPANANFYEYQSVNRELDNRLSEVSMAAYRAVGGVGYGRLDIRMDSNSGKLFVLEVNAQCGLSEDENYTSIGAILRFAGVSFAEVVKLIIDDAFARRGLAY